MRGEIYCGGSLLEAVQSQNLFQDCKHFVDMPLKCDAEIALNKWQLICQTGVPDATALRIFIEEHFDSPGGELEDHEPTDFNLNAEKLSGIVDQNYRHWAQELHRKWPTLCRKVSEKVHASPNRYSLIALPKPFVVPGGRFREMYYWDSFFTIKGLLVSGMYATARGMIENMGHLIDQYGYVPNGNRIYYLNRSQPPLLTWCVHEYFKSTNDTDFVKSALPWLEKEFEFFRTNRAIQHTGWKSHLYRYHVVAQAPRPESWREDFESAEHISEVSEKHRLWGDIAAAAESGRDFSSRWFTHDGPMAGKMGSTRTSEIIPVDLNAIICGNLRMMGEMFQTVGDTEKALKAFTEYEIMREAIHQVFWNEACGCWFDYDIKTNMHVNIYFDTNFFPLFTGCTHEGFDSGVVAQYLSEAGVLSFPGGLPSSLISSGQQWDFPNAWAPTTWVVINGLRNNGQQELAKTIADKWIRKNYIMWLNSGGRMFEKYNVESQCFKTAGGGGEYELQEGFGWTNGVILDLLHTYKTELKWDVETPDAGCECCVASEITPATLTLTQAVA
ncbi:hypothetical protein L596_025136 [Steinernema carpocapsae]|uniref:Trehalase n=1 Tax=Steinernema carpocapsae TaxID=34508 RepID=A0A4U5M6X3_STECR|nr:hypothetical protein L596_025136 [Steinernema carpocapsae]